ncbi:DNA-directed RNA polymerase subunit beta [bacterium LRH843]|nr:DNA-directed RNA polymerase subunit beta [bacterium LRH843]
MTEQEPLTTNEAMEEKTIEEKDKDKEGPARRFRSKRKPKARLRLIPIWLRLILAILLIGGSLLLGLIFGYGVIGGGEPQDALRPETWYHIIDIIRGA